MSRMKSKLLWASALLLFFALPDKHVFAQQMRIKKDLAYSQLKQGALRETSLDVYAPSKGENHPVVIWVHGGGWKFGNKADVNLKPAAFTKAGYVLVSINYRLHPRADFRKQAADIAMAVKWVKKNISEYAGDKNQISLMGHSAGAHLCALVGVDKTYLNKQDIAASDIKGIVLLDGACYHVADHLRDIPENIFKSLFVLIFSQNEKLQKAASPVELVSAKTKMPPFLILHIANRPDSKHQSELLANKIKTSGGSAELLAIKGENHATLNFTLGLPEKAATKSVFGFLGLQMKQVQQED